MDHNLRIVRSKEEKVTIPDLKSKFSYDPYTGIVKNKRLNQPAGSVDANGYIIIMHGRMHLRAHRVAWALYTGSWPVKYIDHINRNRSDNRICNLREADGFQNAANSGVQSNSKTGYTGVYYRTNRDRFVARVTHRGVRHTVGMAFRTAEEAHSARCQFITKHGIYDENNL